MSGRGYPTALLSGHLLEQAREVERDFAPHLRQSAEAGRRTACSILVVGVLSTGSE